MRRRDVEDILGRIPTPKVDDGQFFLEILFQIGPFRGDLPLSEADFEPWERRREIELLPWQAELIVDLSKAYMSEMHAAKELAALCPWPKGQNMWKYVQDQKHKRDQQAAEERKKKEKHPDGNRKRR